MFLIFKMTTAKLITNHVYGNDRGFVTVWGSSLVITGHADIHSTTLSLVFPPENSQKYRPDTRTASKRRQSGNSTVSGFKFDSESTVPNLLFVAK